MVKVECIECGMVGFTASPRFITCSCGGRFREVPERGKKVKVDLPEDILALYDATTIFQHGNN